MGSPRLIAFGGLPGTGKTTIARELARRLGAAYLRIDTLEHSLAASGTVALTDLGPGGYLAAAALAGRPSSARRFTPRRRTVHWWGCEPGCSRAHSRYVDC